MSSRAHESPRLPDGFWARQDVSRALTDRDVGRRFRPIGKYAGASQSHRAIAVKKTQGQVSTIMSGTRRVSAIEVAERLFDGLDAPDAARMAFGLAPRTPSTVAGDAQRPSTELSADLGDVEAL